METRGEVNRVSFSQLINLFVRKSQDRFVLRDSIGSGFAQIYHPEKGLQACTWDCSFTDRIEIFNEVSDGNKNPYFTLAFFLNTQGLRFATHNILLKESIVWNCVFISAASNYNVFIDPSVRARCLSISFSKNWFENNIAEGNEHFKILKDKICALESFLFFDSMNASEKKLVQELFDVSWKKSLGSFYIKSTILKIISDFFHKIKERKSFALTGSGDDIITMIENYLNNHLAEPLPDLKDLAPRFGISASTLRRHFKERNGMNISTYFICKKMEYAKELMDKKHMTPTETAQALGYINVHHFMRMYQKVMNLPSH
jgi:AraC-like DNA-binding protein